MRRRIEESLAGRYARDENAQGLIEFAFVAMILMLLFLGTVDYARFLYYDNAIRSAARVGAETASNHCAFQAGYCGLTRTAVADSYVLWSTYCEARPYDQLNPAYTSCIPGTSSTWTPTCSGTCTNCANDICVSPSARSSGTQVSVSVGYSFKPISPLMSSFFTERSCFTGDSATTNHHTLCSTSIGRVL